MHAARCTLLAFLLVASSACRDRNRQERAYDDEDRSGAATVTAAIWVPNDAAIDRLVAARCAREITCDEIGPDRRFASDDACTRTIRDGAAGLGSRACPAGIDGVALERCLDAIRMEPCTRPSEEMDRLAPCRPRALCLKAEMPHR